MSYETNFYPEVFHTEKGTPYLKECGVAVLAHTVFDPGPIAHFIQGFDKEAGFDAEGYVADFDDQIYDAEKLIKAAGQICYLSFSENRTKDMKKYLDVIKSSGHGSVLEHASVTLLIWGIGRDCTHELVRHRAGYGFSQVSQRFVDGKALRFVARAENQKDSRLVGRFERWIDMCREEYDERARLLSTITDPAGKTKTELRKAVNQAARACLPNETEAPIIVTANMRAWRHGIDMRAAKAADLPIRSVFVRACEALKQVAPTLMDDHEFVTLTDGTRAVEAKYKKV